MGWALCNVCGGRVYVECEHCRGTGKREVYREFAPDFKWKEDCEACGGTGQVRCPAGCNKGRVWLYRQ
jgi:DnaJ-class molecular chaperone